MTLRRLGLCALAALMLAAPAAAPAAYVSQPVPQDRALGSGPWPAVMQAAPGLPTHTLYRPKDLGAVRGRLPVLVWGEGACANEGNRFRWFLSEIASHGYVVLATGPIAGPDKEIWKEGAGNPPVTPGQPQPAMARPPATHSAQLIDAIDWAARENARPASPLYHRLDLSKIAAGGMSCGGAQAIEASFDPRVTTTLVMDSGLFPGETTMGGGKALTKADLKRLHGPVAYISGDASDVAYTNAEDDFGRIEHVPALRAYRKDTRHEGTYGEPNGGDFGKVAVAWLDWTLKGDRTAARVFTGPDCGLCKDPKWVVRSKRLQP